MRNYDHILNLAKDLQDAGHRVSVPVDLSERGYSDRTKMKAEFMKNMFESIRSCDSILVVNDIDREAIRDILDRIRFYSSVSVSRSEKPCTAWKTGIRGSHTTRSLKR